MLEYAEAHSWDTLTVDQVLESGKQVAVSTQRFVTNTINGTKPQEVLETAKLSAEKKTKEAKAAVVKVVNESKTKVGSIAAVAKKELEDKTDQITGKTAALAQHQAQQVSDELLDLVQKAENALGRQSKSSVPTPVISASNTSDTPAPAAKETKEDKAATNVYEVPLPVGFEPPPGFSRPAPPKKEAPPTPEPTTIAIPLIAPAVSSLSASEPIITHLAGTIDNLASYLSSNPAAASKVSDVLETAKTDLTALADRIEKAKEGERAILESKLDEQTREYTLKLMELEMEAQDKLDSQEDDFRKFFDEEKSKTIQAYRAKLEHELQTQTELINERYVFFLSYITTSFIFF